MPGKPKIKMKSLKPSMRERKRYLLVKGDVSNKNIENAILDFIGILGMSKTGLGFIKKNKGSAIISINRKMVDSVRASFAVSPIKLSVEKISGTLKRLGK